MGLEEDKQMRDVKLVQLERHIRDLEAELDGSKRAAGEAEKRCQELSEKVGYQVHIGACVRAGASMICVLIPIFW